MSYLIWFRLAAVRLLIASFIVAALYLLIATIDLMFGTSIIFVIWQWLGKLWLWLGKWVQYLSRFLVRWLPGLAKRFVFRKSLSGVSKIFTSLALAVLFYVLGGERYRAMVRWLERSKSATVQAALAAWRVELWFFPRWLRAGVFIAATVASVFTFAEIQAWAETRNSPTIYGIDPWSFVFGLVASFFLTNLPLIGFDHFLSHVFKPLQHRYRRIIRRKGVWITILNWLVGLRPARRRAELERKRFMRRWHAQSSRATRPRDVPSPAALEKETLQR